MEPVDRAALSEVGDARIPDTKLLVDRRRPGPDTKKPREIWDLPRFSVGDTGLEPMTSSV